MTDLNPSPRRHWGHAILLVLLTMMAGGVLVLWAWNSIAADLFQAPEARFKHAIALQAAIAALTALPLTIVRQLRRRPPQDR